MNYRKAWIATIYQFQGTHFFIFCEDEFPQRVFRSDCIILYISIILCGYSYLPAFSIGKQYDRLVSSLVELFKTTYYRKTDGLFNEIRCTELHGCICNHNRIVFEEISSWTALKWNMVMIDSILDQIYQKLIFLDFYLEDLRF